MMQFQQYLNFHKVQQENVFCQQRDTKKAKKQFVQNTINDYDKIIGKVHKEMGLSIINLQREDQPLINSEKKNLLLL